MIEELQTGSACDCLKRQAVVLCGATESARDTRSVQVQTLKFVSCLMHRADLRAAAVLTATGADDCHA